MRFDNKSSIDDEDRGMGGGSEGGNRDTLCVFTVHWEPILWHSSRKNLILSGSIGGCAP